MIQRVNTSGTMEVKAMRHFFLEIKFIFKEADLLG